ncbi:hypothetical protein A3F66_05470 [candidate division TM6 bacterium RIFCSPHIGHO2_12_FULL_32_22]|nr:MAG: hypothetical protein A3F66_05470 [candidate division TM6 bacterium RIFCSPHIGHO2_12_FULL_32_22]
MASKIIRYLTIILLGMLIIQALPIFIKKIKEEYFNMIEPKTKVGLICVNDMIKSSGKTCKYLKKYFEDKNIKAILLKIDSQGGYAGSSEAIFLEILALKKDFPKPIITLTENICASGGYLVAAATDYIIAAPSCTVGSIGSYLGYFKLKEFINNWKVQYEIQKSGKYKSICNPFTETTKEEEELLKNVSESSYKVFLENVAQTRKLSLKDKDIWAEGKVFTGSQALKVGLVDELGTRSNAIKKIKDLAFIDNKIEWVKADKQNMLEKLIDEDDDECAMAMSKILENCITNLLSKKFINHY